MDSFQDEISYKNRIGLEDRDKILSLLEEYSVKLLRKCDFIDKNLRLFNLVITFLCCVALFVFVASAIYIYSGAHSSILVITASLSFILFCILLNIIIDGPISIKKNVIDSRTHEAHSLAHRLEKLVRIASEFYEHVEKREISKIELDLKIAEAESVLSYYDSIVGKPTKYSDKK